MSYFLKSLLLMLVLMPSCEVLGEDGYELWLRYRPFEENSLADSYRDAIQGKVIVGSSPVITTIRAELARALKGILGKNVPDLETPTARGILIVATLDDLQTLDIQLRDQADLKEQLGKEGYLIRLLSGNKSSRLLITANDEAGLLYGTFAFLRSLQTQVPLSRIDQQSTPKINHRTLQHWDNLNGSTERVYSENNHSIWWGDEDGSRPVPLERWKDYGRACASIGINTVVLNNVNAKAKTLTPSILEKVKVIADTLRPYGIRVGLSVNFASPLSPEHKFRGGPGIGDLDTADPTDAKVIAWWKGKIEEIYSYVPDMAGFLVKAGAEGMSGPEQYGLQASDAANMFGELLTPHNGILMWRTFTWDDIDPDPVKRQSIRFAPQDKNFNRGNVFLQSKYGARDFMIREPFHPLFGQMVHAQMSIELQVTQEYTGHDKYLMFWGPLWQEIFQSDTFARGEHSTVAKVIDGSLHGYDDTQIAGVANISRVRNWTGHHFAQANWYAFGRFAWNPDVQASQVAEEWVRMTWGNQPELVEVLVEMTMSSHETVANYVGPLGIAHANSRDWKHYKTSVSADDYWQKQFINAKQDGIGKDRTIASGTGATQQYQPEVAKKFESLETCPPGVLLWFHHVNWNTLLPATGKTVWEALMKKYKEGVSTLSQYRRTWKALSSNIDKERYQHVLGRLKIQHAHAIKFRKTWITHFKNLQKQGE